MSAAAQLRLLIVGPPGAGKGTQAARIAERFQIPWISTGDMFRTHIAAGTALGVRVRQLIDSGTLVSDDLTTEIVAHRLRESDVAHGFLLDGYPRTTGQARSLDHLLAAHARALDGVVLLRVNTEVVVARLLQRAEVAGRTDDTEAVIRHRQEVYARQTHPVTDLYEQRGLLLSVDGVGTVDEVTARIFAAIDNRAVAAT